MGHFSHLSGIWIRRDQARLETFSSNIILIVYCVLLAKDDGHCSSHLVKEAKGQAPIYHLAAAVKAHLPFLQLKSSCSPAWDHLTLGWSGCHTPVLLRWWSEIAGKSTLDSDANGGVIFSLLTYCSSRCYRNMQKPSSPESSNAFPPAAVIRHWW